MTSIKSTQEHTQSATDTKHLQDQQSTCVQLFEQWGEEEQVEFVTELLGRMCHYQHGQVNQFLKPMLQRDFITALPGLSLFVSIQLSIDTLHDIIIYCFCWFRFKCKPKCIA